uniref:LIP1 domain-containing protein n=1 Tax=Glossina brevipalpis TaxID=37001 RepID=A0A1A9WES2_9MUSC
MDPQQIVELAKLLKNNGDKILNSEFTLTLSGSILRALTDSFTLIVDSMECGDAKNFQVLKTINSKSSVFRDLQLIYDFVQKTPQLCIIHYPCEEYFDGIIDVKKFRALKRLEVQKIHIQQIVGIQPLRGQLEYLVCNKSLQTIDDIITNCGGDNSNGFVWNELKTADFSYNQLQTVDTSLEFAQYLQHLNLRHNQLFSVKAIKWLPNLKTLDLSFNRLTQIPQFHMDAYKRLQTLNMSNNLVEDLTGIVRLDALTELDLSDNCLLDHSYLLPLHALITLKFLNLYGNPLYYHPKHRMAAAQYLHKNCVSVKFILDYESLTKNEKSLIGTQRIRQLGALNRYVVRSSPLNTPSRLSSTTEQTPASSIGSLRSFKLSENNSAHEDVNTTIETKVRPIKKKVNKTRTVEIIDNSSHDSADETRDLKTSVEAKNMSQSLIINEKLSQEHLDTKRHIETLREKYGNEWLQADNAQMINNAVGIEPSNTSSNNNMEIHRSRQLFNELLQDTITHEKQDGITIHSSTPISKTSSNNLTSSISSIKTIPIDSNQETSVFEDMEQSAVNQSKTDTFYQTAKNNITNENEHEDNNSLANQINESSRAINDIYSSATNNESENSEPEEDEETYIVYTSGSKDAIFLTKSSNFLRERDPLTERTKTKWSLKILESCDRLKSNTLRINFDTVKKDKQERVYTVEEDLCQELEKKLRLILSQRDLYEMNQIVYRCVNCNCQFSQEEKKSNKSTEIHCPDCKSAFVAEIHELSRSLEKSRCTEKLSPAADIVKDLPAAIITPLLVEEENSLVTNDERTDDDNSIGSANSLNASSSISQITSNNSDSSLNSNQTCFIDRSTHINHDRIEELKTNGESDIDIISNPSQSSIEVLDRDGNRKISEERCISQAPNLETINDFSYDPSTLEREFENAINEKENEINKNGIVETNVKSEIAPVAQFNLTESSSSGSFTDSICTTYEQQAQKLANKTKEFPQLEAKLQASDNLTIIKEVDGFASEKDENLGLSSRFGAFFQSTNMLMTSSKKLIESEASAAKNNNSNSCQPYKFNYVDFNDIDHRLKLYFYQTKFEEKDEHFKLIIKGRIYNQQSSNICNGLVVMSTCKCYLMEAYASENDDVKKWLRPIMSCTVDRLQQIQLLPWKIGLAFQLRDWGSFLLLLQDISRTNSLLLYFANNSLPAQCDLIYQPAKSLVKRLSSFVGDEQLNMFCLLNGCDVTCDNAKRSFQLSGLIATDSRLYLTSNKLLWLCEDNEHDNDIELCVMQLMSNLVEIERPAENVALINFLDETHNKCELWRCYFETSDLAASFLNAIAQSWEKLFGVPLFNT